MNTPVDVIVIPSAILQRLIEIAAGSDREVVAALHGVRQDDHIFVSRVRQLRNQARSRTQFVIDKSELHAGVVLFHSHTLSKSFSQQDKQRISQSTIPWMVGFPTTRGHEQTRQAWGFEAASADGAGGYRPCKIHITEESSP